MGSLLLNAASTDRVVLLANPQSEILNGEPMSHFSEQSVYKHDDSLHEVIVRTYSYSVKWPTIWLTLASSIFYSLSLLNL